MEDDRIISFEEFLRDSDAYVAPNFDYSEKIIEWLRVFEKRGSENKVYVLVQSDETHLTDKVYLAGPKLNADDREQLTKFNADGIRELWRGERQKLFPHQNDSSATITEVVWD